MTSPAPALTIGIAIPFYSRLDYLRTALASLVEQSDPDWTAVVVDDHSPETGVGALVGALADPRIRHVRNDRNLGLAANFNRCLGEPATDVVAIFHADDVLERDYIAVIRSAHRGNPHAAMVAPMATAIDGDGKPIDTIVDRVKRRLWPGDQRHELRGDAGLARLMHGFFVYCPAMSYRPALLRERPFDERWKQVMDVDLIADVLLAGGTVLLDRTPVYRYRRHAGTVTAANARALTRLAEESAVAREIASAANSLGWARTARAARLRWSVRLNGLVALATTRGTQMGARRAAARDLVSR